MADRAQHQPGAAARRRIGRDEHRSFLTLPGRCPGYRPPMGFLDKAKRAVKGPVTIDVAVPDTFRWTDESLAATANLKNETDEPLTIAEVRFSLEARTSGNEKGSKSRWKKTLSDPFVLDPGMSVDKTAEFPLTLDISRSTMQGAATDAGLPEWVGSAMKSIVGDIPRRSGPHQMKVTVKLADSARLSNGRATTSAV